MRFLKVVRFSSVGAFFAGIIGVIQGCSVEREGALFAFLLLAINFCTGPGDPVETACTPTTQIVTFNFTGAQEDFTVPAGVTAITIFAAGAEGGGLNAALGGRGGTAEATFIVLPGKALHVFVGGKGGKAGGGAGGGNGGGFGRGGSGRAKGPGGGGASDVRRGGTDFGHRIIVGGGGGGHANGPGAGGHGGGLLGIDGGVATNGGKGGTQTAGGNKGGTGASDGVEGVGGDSVNGGGGGGGGWFGGGGGALNDGGGGGSGFGPAGTIFQTGTQLGHGLVTLTYQGCN